MIEELLQQYSVVVDTSNGCGSHNGRPVRLLEHLGLFQVGDSDFDRWANSVDLEFDYKRPSDLRALKRWLGGNNG